MPLSRPASLQRPSLQPAPRLGQSAPSSRYLPQRYRQPPQQTDAAPDGSQLLADRQQLAADMGAAGRNGITTDMQTRRRALGISPDEMNRFAAKLPTLAQTKAATPAAAPAATDSPTAPTPKQPATVMPGPAPLAPVPSPVGSQSPNAGAGASTYFQDRARELYQKGMNPVAIPAQVKADAAANDSRYATAPKVDPKTITNTSGAAIPGILDPTKQAGAVKINRLTGKPFGWTPGQSDATPYQTAVAKGDSTVSMAAPTAPADQTSPPQKPSIAGAMADLRSMAGTAGRQAAQNTAVAQQTYPVAPSAATASKPSATAAPDAPAATPQNAPASTVVNPISSVIDKAKNGLSALGGVYDRAAARVAMKTREDADGQSNAREQQLEKALADAKAAKAAALAPPPTQTTSSDNLGGALANDATNVGRGVASAATSVAGSLGRVASDVAEGTRRGVRSNLTNLVRTISSGANLIPGQTGYQLRKIRKDAIDGTYNAL